MDDFRLRALAAREGDAVHETVLGDSKNLWFALPSIINKDSDGHVSSASSAVNLPILQLDGTIKMVPYPDFDTSPVHYPGGGGVTHTHPVKKGDEGVMMFMSRAQDLWHQKGGTQDPIDFRTFALADSRWIPGGRSDPRKLSPPPSTSSQQSRSDDGKHVWDLHPGNGLTAASTVKHLVNVGGTSGSGTVHLPSDGDGAKIIKNAAKVLINCIKHEGLPDPGTTFANKKLVATIPVGAMGKKSSQISSIMSSVMSGGIGALLSSPTAGAGTSLLSSITSGASAITSALGGAGAGVVSALTGSGGLVNSLTGLLTGASALSGATSPLAGSYGLGDVVSHAQGLTQFFGSDIPPAVALSTVTAPMNPQTLIDAQAQVTSLVAQLVATTMTPAAGVTAVNALNAQMAALMPAANSAIAALQAAKADLTLAQLAGSLGVTLDNHEAAVFSAIASPNLTALASAMASVFSLSESDASAITSFPDSSADSAGAAAGFAR